MKIFKSNSILFVLVQTVCIIWMVNSSEINENGLVDANMSPKQDKFDDVTTVVSDDDLKTVLSNFKIVKPKHLFSLNFLKFK